MTEDELVEIGRGLRTQLALMLAPMEDAVAGGRALAGAELEGALRNGRRLLALTIGMSEDGARDHGVRILVADDNAEMRDYLARRLGKRWTVEVSSDGAEALI